MVIISNDLQGNSLNRKNHVPTGMNGSSQPLWLCYLFIIIITIIIIIIIIIIIAVVADVVVVLLFCIKQ